MNRNQKFSAAEITKGRQKDTNHKAEKISNTSI